MAKRAGGDGFRGFGSQALPFLSALKENNDREWFAANKETFLEECDRPFRELIAEVGELLEEAGGAVEPLPKNPVYRIYRDVRFSKDKAPYKTNLGSGLHREGDKKKPGRVYVHVEPAASFLAAGFYHPDAPELRLLREALLDKPAKFLKLVATLESKGIAHHHGDPIRRMPKGFEDHAESPVADYLKMRSFLISRPLADEDLERRDLPKLIADFAADAEPYLKTFWAKLEEN